ncbi:M14 family metallopeptidase [Virgibacillus salexigens]|uniref:M14 family metallopeptidase n=1 Tax=Virgibacillus salexigens TaxID=61016 RepID=UPI00190C0F05|nr:M14 family metallopeptidase [Virgibacillus salexigens]
MSQKNIGTLWDRTTRTDINNNFAALFKMREILNDLIIEGLFTEQQMGDVLLALNDAIKKGHLSVNDIDKNKGLLDQSFMSEEFLEQIAGNTPINSVPADESVTTGKIADNAIVPSKTNFFYKTPNIFDGEYHDWYIYDYGSSSENPTAYLRRNYQGEEHTLMVQVIPGETYTIKIHDKGNSNQFTIATAPTEPSFDETGIFDMGKPVHLQGKHSTPEREYTLTIPEGDNYLYAMVAQDQEPPSKIQIEQGEDASIYTSPYMLNTNLYIQGAGENENQEAPRKIKTLTSQNMYNVPTLESVNLPDSTVKIHDVTSTDMFGFYDSLMADNPTYITKELATNETTGLPIYKYIFKPEQPEIGRIEAETDLLHFFIVSGVHGSEKASWWCVYETMKQICENWRNSDVLESLRWNIKFTVIPIVNVYGIDNPDDPITLGGKKNANGIDINRSFPEGFVVYSDPEYAGYGGEEPLTQPEAIMIADILQNEEVDFYTDFHNFSSNPNPNYFMWNISDEMHGINMSQDYYTHLSLKWKKQDELFPQSNDVFFGYSSVGTGGSTPPYIRSLGIPGSIFEISHTMHPKGDSSQYSSEVVTLGTEAQLNWLYLAYKNLTN